LRRPAQWREIRLAATRLSVGNSARESINEVSCLANSKSIDVFCRVVDNYGDIGICWRLARQFEREHGRDVTLWVDDLRSFQRICPTLAIDADVQQIAGVTVRHWRDQEQEFSGQQVADIVIEFFGCDIPPGYIAAMATRTPRPVWLNLEGLTAEEWVEGCHTLPSPHPRLPLTKHFFFPGFTARTGGLLREASLTTEVPQFQSDHVAGANFLAQIGVTPAEMAAFKVSLFCYPHAPVQELFAAWQGGDAAVICLVPEGVAGEAVTAFIGTEALAGSAATRGALTVRVIPFVAQSDYDKILWACDLNFVRGEDSFVRAQWAGKPFVWHIYPQDENLHRKKLRAFLGLYAAGLCSLHALAWAWNDALDAPADWPQLWQVFKKDMPELTARALDWEQEMLKHGDLASNLLSFADSLR
jgi:uncharacterized repeat protein (TIGR03837 family)